MIPNIWYHGDWASIDEDGYWFLHGRADDVIKVAGKRIGPAEIESILNKHDSTYETACVGMPHEVKGEEVVCFVVLKPGKESSSTLREELITEVIKSMGKPFKPREINFVNDLPRTRSGKILRRLIRAIRLGKDLSDISALENPKALEELRIIRTDSQD